MGNRLEKGWAAMDRRILVFRDRARRHELRDRRRMIYRGCSDQAEISHQLLRLVDSTPPEGVSCGFSSSRMDKYQ